MEYGVYEGLKDKPRSGKPRTITPESRAWIVSLMCTKPKDFGYPHEVWTQRLLVQYIMINCVKEGHPELSKLSQGTISKISNAGNIKVHKIRYYMNKVDPEFNQKAAVVISVYKKAKKLRNKFKKKVKWMK